MIKAKGKIAGMNVEVEYDGKNFLFNGEKNKIFQNHLIKLLELGKPILGTYIPKDPYEKINIIEILRNDFFDKRTEVWTDDDIKSISKDDEKGVIY